ncbi:hypothetical protein CUC08_Gglean011271 [Alternaria sp. MG1]|nr:hypothetical protein CUC08_Gglean011271 [Alternaria sp. MG1]
MANKEPLDDRRMHIALTVHDKEGKQLEDFPVKVYKIKYSDELQTELEQKEEEERKNEPEAKPKPSPKKAETPTQPGGSNPGTPVSPPNAAVPTNGELQLMFYDFARKISPEETKQIAAYFSKVQGLRIPVQAPLFSSMRENARITKLPVWHDPGYIDFLDKTKQLTEESRLPYAERFTKEELKEERERNERAKRVRDELSGAQEKGEEQESKRVKLTGANHHKRSCLHLFTPELQKNLAEVLADAQKLRQNGFWK